MTVPVPALQVMPLPPASRKLHGLAADFGFAAGSGLVNAIIVPVFIARFCGHATSLAFTLKHGSMMLLPIMQRNASARGDAFELVQQ